jgi:malate dehydrogenase (oxaloacetate-decarboxylating)(NADP+)
MADTAVVPEILETLYSFSSLKGGANLLVCPDLQSANIAVKLLAKLGNADCIGPIILGIRKPVYLLIPGNEVADIVNVTAMAVRDAQESTEDRNAPVAPAAELKTVYE